MALTYTEQLPLGFAAPDFRLHDAVSGKELSLSDLKGEVATVVMFICNHCPYVVHVREELVRMGNEYMPKGIAFVAINSNDVMNYPADHPDLMKDLALELKMPFPYLYDESQEVAKAYYAVCTPDFSIFDKELKCIYRGQLDGSRPGSGIPVTGADIRNALNALVNEEEVLSLQVPSVGCSIKWKA